MVLQLQLPAELLHVDVHGPALAQKVDAPGFGKELLPAETHVPVLDEDVQQGELLGRQVDPLPGQQDLVGVPADDEIADGVLRLRPVGPPQHRLDPGQKLRHLEGLHDVVVRAEAEAPDLVRGGAPGREEDGGHAPHLLHDGKPLHVRQHHIEEHEIEPLLPRRVDGVSAREGGHALVAHHLQVHLQQVVDGPLVLHDQYLRHCSPLPFRFTYSISGKL